MCTEVLLQYTVVVYSIVWSKTFEATRSTIVFEPTVAAAATAAGHPEPQDGKNMSLNPLQLAAETNGDSTLVL